MKVNEEITVVYQPAKAPTGLTDATMQIYDETGAPDAVNFPDVTMTEIGSTGRYEGKFTPDAIGTWLTMMEHGNGKNPMFTLYKVHEYDVDDAVEAAGDPTLAV